MSRYRSTAGYNILENMSIATPEHTEVVIRELRALTLEKNKQTRKRQSKDRSYSHALARPSSVSIAPSVKIKAQAGLKHSK